MKVLTSQKIRGHWDLHISSASQRNSHLDSAYQNIVGPPHHQHSFLWLFSINGIWSSVMPKYVSRIMFKCAVLGHGNFIMWYFVFLLFSFKDIPKQFSSHHRPQWSTGQEFQAHYPKLSHVIFVIFHNHWHHQYFSK